MIELKVNGKDARFEVEDLKQLLNVLEKNEQNFAVAINEIFIAKADYFKTLLNNGDQIEIVQPMQGG